MFKKVLLVALTVSLGIVSSPSFASAESKTTTVETNTQVESTPAPTTKKSKVAPVTTTTTYNTRATTTTEVESRRVLNEDTLKKISDTLCTDGFKAYIGREKKNVCQGTAVAPDLAYSCVWKKKGTAAYDPSGQGPCNLDFVEHRGSRTITKSDYVSRPPLPYGTEAQCCFRAAKGTAVTH